MSFSIKKALDEANLVPFDVEGADGETYELPHIGGLTIDQAIRIESAGENITALLDEIVDERTAAMLRTLPQSVFQQLFEAWQEHSGVNAGESAASSSS